jgi:hypothetical protein
MQADVCVIQLNQDSYTIMLINCVTVLVVGPVLGWLWSIRYHKSEPFLSFLLELSKHTVLGKLSMCVVCCWMATVCVSTQSELIFFVSCETRKAGFCTTLLFIPPYKYQHKEGVTVAACS